MILGHFSSLDKSLIKISGKESLNFLNSLITNDVQKVSVSQGIYALLLTPQAKFLYDMFIIQIGQDYLIEIDKSERDNLIKRLLMYKLRTEVTIEKEDNIKVTALWGENILPYYNLALEGEVINLNNLIIMVDPRFKKLGLRIYSVNSESFEFELGNYDHMRIKLGVPEGFKDLIKDKSFPLHYGLDKLNAIDYNKGCYVGQEVISRTTYRGVVRKKVFIVNANLELQKGQELLYNDSEKMLVCSVSASNAIVLANVTEEQKEFPNLVIPEWYHPS